MTKTKRKSSEELKEDTATKKAKELSTLCGIEVCMISYGVNGEMKIYPEDQQRVAAMANRFMKLSEASRSKKSTSLDDVLKDIQKMKTTTKKQKKEEKVVTVDPNLGSQFDSYSIDDLKMKLESIRRKFQSINEWRENMNNINYGNSDRIANLGFQITKKIDYGNMASSSSSSSSSFPLGLGFEGSNETDYGNITTSSSPSFPRNLGFESNNNKSSNNKSNNIFRFEDYDDIEEDDEFNLPPDFGFIDLKEVDYMLRDNHVEEETWNQQPLINTTTTTTTTIFKFKTSPLKVAFNN